MNTQDILTNIDEKTKAMWIYLENVESLKDEIKVLKKKLFKVCEHDWVRDWEEPSDSKCKWKCGQCNLSRNPHYN